MGKRDFERREVKKPKKGATKAPPTIIGDLTPPPIVEVVRRKRKEVREDEEVE